MTKILPDPVGTEHSASSPLLFIQNFEVILKSEPVNLTTAEMSTTVLPGTTEESSDARKLSVSSMRSGGGGGGGPLGPRPERVYSHGLLLELKDHPLARQWPPYLDPAFKNSRGVWDPDRWHLERKRGETPVAGESKDGPDVVKEGKKEKKDKVLLGPEGEDLQQLVLSPQRRSFLGGCSNAAGELEVNLRPEPPGKRVGSGRLIARQEEERPGAGPGGFRRPGEEMKRFPGDKFGGLRRDRDEESWGDDRRRDGYFQQEERRDGKRMDDRDRRPRRRNEPEWMNETISHNDVIELRGFEDPKTAKMKESAAAPVKRQVGRDKFEPAQAINVQELERGVRMSREKSEDQNKNLIAESEKVPAGHNNIDILNDLGIGSKSNDEFNFDAMMELMNNGSIQHDQAAPPAAESRFSKFFNKGSEVSADPKNEIRRGSLHDALLGVNILNEINGEEGPVIKIPSPTEEQRYFAPISPAAQTRATHNPIMEMINKGNKAGPPRVQDLEEGLRRSLGLGGGHQPPPASVPQHQPQNVQELFKQLQQGPNGQHGMAGHHPMAPPRGPVQDHNQQPESMSAFKKLVAMVGQTPDNMSQGLPPLGPGVVRPNPLPGNLPSGALTEQEILEQMSAPRHQPPVQALHQKQVKSNPHQIPPAVLSFIANHPLNMELISRPEGKQLLMGLESGNINVDHLVQQLNNPALQQRQRDVLLSVLKLVTLQRQGGVVAPTSRVSPLMFPPAPPSHLSISPSAQQRVPSPQEMTVLTQHIMQQALIKKKLEEQRENFRKRHGDPPAMSAQVSGGSPLAFTPTSVMRKNAAERKDSDPQIKAVPELKITPGQELMDIPLPPSPGRAITKTKEELGQRRPSPQMFPPGQPNPLHYLQNNLAPVSHSMLSQANALAQQQLAASLMVQGVDPRHLANRLPPPPRPHPPAGPPAGPGGSLARFFSPEVLAQAQSGAVPAMPAMPQILPQQQAVLTLEEIEMQAKAVRI